MCAPSLGYHLAHTPEAFEKCPANTFQTHRGVQRAQHSQKSQETAGSEERHMPALTDALMMPVSLASSKKDQHQAQPCPIGPCSPVGTKLCLSADTSPSPILQQSPMAGEQPDTRRSQRCPSTWQAMYPGAGLSSPLSTPTPPLSFPEGICQVSARWNFTLLF